MLPVIFRQHLFVREEISRNLEPVIYVIGRRMGNR
jgi:hypothetical protein